MGQMEKSKGTPKKFPQNITQPKATAAKLPAGRMAERRNLISGGKIDRRAATAKRLFLAEV